jgi:hypothetical protein
MTKPRKVTTTDRRPDDSEELERWTKLKVIEFNAKHSREVIGEGYPPELRPTGWALEEAKKEGYAGDVTALRLMYPEIEDFIQVPDKRKKAQQPRRVMHPDRPSLEAEVVNCVDVILEIWGDDGALKKGDPALAEEIAAKSWSVTVPFVRNARKNRGRYRYSFPQNR